MAETGTPRRGVETSPARAVAQDIAWLKKEVARLAKSASLRNASISGGDGLTVIDAANNVRLRLSPEEGAVIAYAADGSETARYGLLSHTDPGQYGIETFSGGQWVHVGDESVTWANIAGRPSTFTPAAHQHAGGDITSAVASATSAATAGAAAQADGSQYGFDNTVAGTQFYALWVGNDGGYHFGRNTSSLRYKMNVRDFTGAGDLMALRPVVYDRKPSLRPATTADGQPAEGPALQVPGAVNEFGMIAEEVEAVWPEVVTWFDDGDGAKIDGIRYDLVAVRLLPYVQQVVKDNRALTDRVTAQDKLIQNLTTRLSALDGK
jgi:hypothetical protein